MIDNELQELYSCSHWSNKPLSPDEIINAHGEFTAKSNKHVCNFMLKVHVLLIDINQNEIIFRY